MQDTKVAILGTPTIELKEFNSVAGELTVYGNVEHSGYIAGPVYRNLPILRLSYTRELVDQDSYEIEVDDEYPSSYFIPYLKGIPAFRAYLILFLRDAIATAPASQRGILAQVVSVYMSQLRQYSDVKSIVRQAKTCVNSLNPERKNAEQQARAVLEIMERTPTMDISFEVRSAP